MHIRTVHCILNFMGETASVPRRKEFQFIRMPKYTYSIWMLYIQVCTYLYGTRVFSALYITAAPSAREIRDSVQWLAEFLFLFFLFLSFCPSIFEIRTRTVLRCPERVCFYCFGRVVGPPCHGLNPSGHQTIRPGRVKWQIETI